MSPVQDERLGVLRLRTSLGRPRMRRCLRPQFRARVRAIREGCGFNTLRVACVPRRTPSRGRTLFAPCALPRGRFLAPLLACDGRACESFHLYSRTFISPFVLRVSEL